MLQRESKVSRLMPLRGGAQRVMEKVSLRTGEWDRRTCGISGTAGINTPSHSYLDHVADFEGQLVLAEINVYPAQASWPEQYTAYPTGRGGGIWHEHGHYSDGEALA